MKTQKNTILPSTPSDIEKQIEYNKELTNKLRDVIREIAVDLENLDTRLKALE